MSRSLFFTFLFVSLLGFISVAGAETTPNPELEGILRKIESRHYRWIAIRADVLLFFAKAGDPNAMCGGELLYQRLDERMFLTCVDARQKLMFVFRTLDRRFDLYLPAQNTVYHGSIFDLEDSPDIESHLKARDLYRALKPLAVDPHRAKIERNNSLVTSLDVYSKSVDGSEGALARKLYLTPEGDVRGELFYNPAGRTVTEIQRYDFHEFRGRVGAYDSIIFPKKITITSPETKKGSAIFFTRVTALDTIDPLEFILRVPPGTKEVFLNEKEPRFVTPMKQKVAAPEISGRSHFPIDSQSPGVTVPKKPLEQTPLSVTPISVPSQPKKTRGAPKAPSRENEKPPRDIGPLKSAEKPFAEPAPAEDADADIAVENKSLDEPSSPTDAQTTLDPSVSPSLDMERQ